MCNSNENIFLRCVIQPLSVDFKVRQTIHQSCGQPLLQFSYWLNTARYKRRMSRQSSSSTLCYIFTHLKEKLPQEIIITMDQNQEGLYIVLAVLSGLSFVLSIGLLMYILHFLYSTIYKLLVIEQRCSCRCDPESVDLGNGPVGPDYLNQSITIEIARTVPDLPPSYTQTEENNLPSYEEVRNV